MSESTEPRRIQRKRTKGWRMPPNTVYVGRPTVWGNPFGHLARCSSVDDALIAFKMFADGIWDPEQLRHVGDGPFHVACQAFTDANHRFANGLAYAARAYLRGKILRAGADSIIPAMQTFYWRSPMPTEPRAESRLTDTQIKHMVERFLMWRLPENFNPDGGISFKPTFNEHTPHPMKSEPVGTNLFDYTQAEAMVRYMIDGMPWRAAERDMAERAAQLIEERIPTCYKDPEGEAAQWAYREAAKIIRSLAGDTPKGTGGE